MARKFSVHEYDLLWKEYFRAANNKVGPVYPAAKQIITQYLLWCAGCHNLSWIDESFGFSGGLAAETAAEHSGSSYLASLRACAKHKDLCRGTRLHDELCRNGLLENCSDALVSMYARCGALAKARELFDRYTSRDIFTWTTLIAGCVQNGQACDALCIFEQLQHTGLSPNAVTFASALKACGSIRAMDRGEKLHDTIAKEGLLANNVKLGTALIGMYVKCGALSKAHKVLEELPVRDVISWNALIAGYVERGQDEQALGCFEQMQQEGLSPDAVTLACILRACGRMRAVDKGENFYNEFVKEGLVGKDIILGNGLVDMYVKCGALGKAHQVLRELPARNVVSWNILIGGYANHCEGEQALNCFYQMKHEGISPDAVTFACALKACGSMGAADIGEKLHDEIAKQGLLQSSVKLGTAVVDMYAKCGAFTKARQVLEGLPICTIVAWNALLAGYVEHNKGEEALNCLEQVKREGLDPDVVTFTCALKACGSIGALDEGETIHYKIAEQGLLANHDALGNALVGMYAKCGALVKARSVLEELPMRSVVSWNALIGGYAEQGEGEQALDCFEQMQHENLSPDAVTFAGILKACGAVGALEKGERIHNVIVKQKLLGCHTELGNALVDMYAKCGAFAKAWQVLEELHSRNIISWNALIAGYVEHGEVEQAMNCFEQMQREGLSPDQVTCLCILKACGTIGEAKKGEKIHDEIAKKGWLEDSVVLGTALVDMYARCGALSKARCVLEECRARSVMSWNALIAGYAEHGDGDQALICYEQMQHENIFPDPATFSCILKACGSIGAAQKGEEIHHKIVKQGLIGDNVVLGTALVDMYAKCGDLAKAHRVLEELPVRNVVSWNALITGYVEHHKGEQAMKCFRQMQREGLSPNAVTYTCVLKACGGMGAADKGEEIHDEIAKQGLLGKDVVLDTALVDMYGKCGALAKAHCMLEELPVKNIVSWNTLIARYCQHEEGEQALKCFEQMQREGVCPDSVTFTCVLKACGSIGAADKGEKIHDEIAKQGLLYNNIVLCTALLDMYAKCGALAKSRQVLEESAIKDVISWNALISGLIQQGEVRQALDCFEQMQREGLSPDVATFSSVLSACSRLGLVEDAQSYFINMSTKYGVMPDLEHFACMIDVFGRAGQLDKAAGVIEKLPSSNSGVWSTLLGACRKWGDINVGRWAFEHAMKVDKGDAAVYVLMANIYAAAGMQEDADNIEAMRIANRALMMKPGHSWWVDKGGNTHRFYAGDAKHAQIDRIHAKLDDLAQKVTAFSDSRVHLLSGHCEKLALACALINTVGEPPVHIMLSLPICGECHAATSLISKVENRKIIVWDLNRHHDFQDGICSCGDH